MPEKNSHIEQNIVTLQKFMDRVTKMQHDQDKSRQQEYELLQMHLSQMNVLLDELIRVSGSGSTVAATKKLIPFQTGSQVVGQQLIPPSNPDDYPTRIDVYKINSNRTIPHMTLINDGPGDIFFISSFSNNQFNTKEEHLNVNDQRELFNVYEIRLRSTLPTTSIRLIEGIFRTGSTAPQTKINVEIRPTAQTNEIFLTLTAAFDLQFPTVTINSPTVQTFIADYTFQQPPLPPGKTCTLSNNATQLPMPFNIPEGFIIEIFASFSNSTVDFTARNYFELVLGSGIYSLTTVLPVSSRGPPFNATYNISEYNSTIIDPFGAPAGGRNFLITVTNDDPLENMIGSFIILSVLRRMT